MSVFDTIDIFDEEGRYRVPDPELIKLAETILDLFKQMRPQYAPGVVRVGKKNLIHFYRAGMVCRGAAMPPEAFVKHQLEGMLRVGKFWASAIASSVVMGAVSTHHISDEYVITHYKSQLVLFLNHSKIYGPRATLEHDGNQFSPLFRCALAHQYGFSDIVERYCDAARSELNAKPLAKEILGNSIGFMQHDGKREIWSETL